MTVWWSHPLSETQRKYGLIAGLWSRGVFGARLYLPRVSECGNPRLFRDVWRGFAVFILKSFSTIIRNPAVTAWFLSHFQAGMQVWHQLRSVPRCDWLLIRLLVRVRDVSDISLLPVTSVWLPSPLQPCGVCAWLWENLGFLGAPQRSGVWDVSLDS